MLPLVLIYKCLSILIIFPQLVHSRDMQFFEFSSPLAQVLEPVETQQDDARLMIEGF